MPRELEGMNLDVFAVLTQSMGVASDYGYDPENDFREQYSFPIAKKSRSFQNLYCEFSPHKTLILILDLDRMGTNVLPGYQRMGFGQFLTQHCNEIADKMGCRTWIPASPNGCSMFKKRGFKEVAILDAHIEQYGFRAETGKIYILLRDLPLS